MKSICLKLLFPTLLAALLAAPVAAQSPRQISYQGVLAGPSGNPLPDGNHSITVRLYNLTGTELYSENHTVAVVRGVFNIIIGSVTPFPPSLTFDRQYTLGISVDGGTELSPRTPLVSAPYALHTSTAEQARSLAPGATGVVTSLNGGSGELTLQGGGGTTINRTGNTITISSTGGGGSGIAGVQNSDGSLTITEPNGPVANISVAESGITSGKIADGAVTPAKLGTAGASAGNVLMFNGSNVAWGAPSSGLTLPYSGTLGSSVTAFAIAASGTGGAGSFRNTNSAPAASALYGENNASSPSLLVAGVEGKGTTGFGVIGRGGAGSSAVYGVVATGPTAGSFWAGTGVSGFSDVSNGVGGVTYNPSGAGVYGSATGTGIGVRGFSSDGRAGFFEITTASNINTALEGITAGSGAGVRGANTSSSGSNTGVLGEAASTSHGSGATGGVSGVVGRVMSSSPGGYSAGVRGINNGTAGTGVGVIGYQAGSGWGVYGETPSGYGVYGLTTNNSAASVGVRGETFSTNGVAVEAKYSGTGVGNALEIDNGAIRVTGVNKPAFVHTATPANKLSLNGTDIDNPICNGDASAILLVTQKLNPSGTVYNNSPIGVYYNTIRNKWEIFNENNTPIPNNAQFNVLVIKQ